MLCKIAKGPVKIIEWVKMNELFSIAGLASQVLGYICHQLKTKVRSFPIKMCFKGFSFSYF